MIELFKLSRHLVKLLAIACACLVLAVLPAGDWAFAEECPPGCPDPVDGYQPYPSTIAYYFDIASRNQLGASGPTYPEIQTGWPPAYSQTHVVPAIILKAMGQTENEGWYHFDASYGQVGPTIIVDNPNETCDVGLMQLNSASMDYYGVDRCDAAQSYIYNIGGGARILIRKWNERSSLNFHVGGNNPAIAEDWYYAIWAYNTWTQSNNPANHDPSRPPYRTGEYWLYTYPYQEKVWGWAASPPDHNGTLFWEPVPLTLPDPNQFQPGQDPPPELVRPSPIHPDPHASTHLPNIRVNRYDYDDRSVITVRNVSGDYTAVNITIYDQNGNQVGASDHTLTANASWTVNAFDVADEGIQDLSGSAVVAASPEVAVVVQNRTSSMITAYSGIGPATGTAPDPGFGKVDDILRLPVIMRNHDRYGEKWNTTIYIQNAGTATANVYVKFYYESGAEADRDPEWGTFSIPPGASLELTQSDNTHLESGFRGTAEVISLNEPVAAIVNEVNKYSDMAMAYNAFSLGAQDVYLPLSFRNWLYLNSDIPVKNIGASTTVDVYYYEQGGYGEWEWHDSETIGYKALHIFDPPDGMNHRIAAAVLTNNSSDLIALLHERSDYTQYMTYNGVAKTASMTTSYKSHVPILYRENYGTSGWQSLIQVQNIESQFPNFITADFFDQDGDEILFLGDWVAPNRSTTFYLPSVIDLPNNCKGSAVVEGHHQTDLPGLNVDREVIAIANVQNFDMWGVDRGGGYNGFNR